MNITPYQASHAKAKKQETIKIKTEAREKNQNRGNENTTKPIKIQEEFKIRKSNKHH